MALSLRVEKLLAYTGLFNPSHSRISWGLEEASPLEETAVTGVLRAYIDQVT